MPNNRASNTSLLVLRQDRYIINCSAPHAIRKRSTGTNKFGVVKSKNSQ